MTTKNLPAHREQERQQERKMQFFEQWLNDEFKGTKLNATIKIKELMIIAYKRGRGDRV